jgi:glycosyltransferase involved in cell wall biosynthesis
MNILIVSQNYYPEIGSHANRITDLSVLLDQRGYNVDVLTSEPSYPNKDMYKDKNYWDERKSEIEESNINIIRLKSPGKSRGEGKLRRLVYYFNFLFQTLWYVLSISQKYDFVLVTSPQLFIGVTGLLAKVKCRAKLIFDIRDLWPETVKHVGLYKNHEFTLKMAYALEKIILKAANVIIVNSEGFLPYLKKKGFEEKSHFLPNAIRKERLFENINYRQKDLSSNNFSIVYAGNIGLAQDLRVFVKMANELKDNRNISFTIIGTGVQEQKVREKVEKYGLKNITFKGTLPRKETLREIGKYHLAFINLKNEDVFKTVIPGKLLDYMSVGMPILAGVDGQARKIISDSECGFVCNPGDYKSMSKIVLKLIDNQEELQEAGLKGFRYIEKNFIWEKNIVNFERVMLDLTAGKHKSNYNKYIDVGINN